MELYRKEGSRYHVVDDSEVVGQAFVILAKRGMEDLVSQTIRRLFLKSEVQIESTPGSLVIPNEESAS